MLSFVPTHNYGNYRYDYQDKLKYNSFESWSTTPKIMNVIPSIENGIAIFKYELITLVSYIFSINSRIKIPIRANIEATMI